MRISLCNEVLREHDFAEQCRLSALLGYDGLEIAPFTLGERPWLISAEQRTLMRRQAEDAGLSITGLHALLYTPTGLSITTADRAAWSFTRDVLFHLMDLAVDLGAGIMVHGSPKARVIAPGEETAGAARGLEMFAAVAPGAQERGLTYCVEALAADETNYVTSLDEALAIVETVNNPALCTMIDCCAVGHDDAETVPEAIARTLPTGKIKHVHFNDPNRRGPGEGEMEFAPILKALIEHGYEGDCALEPFRYIPDGLSSAARSIGYLKGLQEAQRFGA